MSVTAIRNAANSLRNSHDVIARAINREIDEKNIDVFRLNRSGQTAQANAVMQEIEALEAELQRASQEHNAVNRELRAALLSNQSISEVADALNGAAASALQKKEELRITTERVQLVADVASLLASLALTLANIVG